MDLFNNSFVEQFNTLTDTQKMYWKELYQDSAPFPHLVVENAFDETMLSEILDAWPVNYNWKTTNIKHEVKLASHTGLIGVPEKIKDFLINGLNSEYFVNFIKELTGIGHLIADGNFGGAGIHNIQRGGKLGIHYDYGFNDARSHYRRVNVLLYLNKEWKDAYNGHLELWSQDKKRLVKKVRPDFNTMVIFNTDKLSWHGHPKPLECPENMSRKSFATYYYSNEKNNMETSEETFFIEPVEEGG